ncbi:MAG TPA: ATP-binding protein, partial [Xanthomonadaceae bacterium]|nr:ATP-binding protein [Xanthomonadaceae bacterium]
MPQSSLLLATLRWITLAAIGGTIVALGIDLASVRGPWLVVALTLGVLSFVCCATALHLLNLAIQQASRSVRKATTEAAAVFTQIDEQTAKFDSLRHELEEYRRLQEELTQAKQAAEQATLAKSEFLATMSHEVRTPLNGIIPMLDLLQSSKLALDQREMLNTALQSARQLLRIVDDILDYSKLEANKLQLETVSLNLRETLDSVIRLLERQAQAKGLRLTLHIDPEVRTAFRGDPVRVRQIISNLVSNALKFTERGSITVHVARLKETRTHHQLRFEVRDTGVGISPEAASKLFSAFSQADASTTRVYGGTGLGLAICKRIVDLMGGRIGVESELGRGSTFWFETPMLKAASEIEGPRTGMQNARLLILTSDPALQKRITASLAQTGANLAYVETTQEVLSQLRSVAASISRGFDVLIVDLASIKHTVVALHRNLANMDGLDRLRILFLEGSDPVP